MNPKGRLEQVADIRSRPRRCSSGDDCRTRRRASRPPPSTPTFLRSLHQYVLQLDLPMVML